MRAAVLLVVALLTLARANEVLDDKKKHHHHHHHHHKRHDASVANKTIPSTPVQSSSGSSPILKAQPRQPTVAVAVAKSTKSMKAETQSVSHTKVEANIVNKMKELENMLAKREADAKKKVLKGQLEVNGPLPFDFSTAFAKGVAAATGCLPSAVSVISTTPVSTEKGNVQLVAFEAPKDVVKAVQAQAANPGSKLASGELHSFLVAKDDVEDAAPKDEATEPASTSASAVDIDVEMPYGDLEPFGREDTAQELTEQSIGESDQMVDQIEKAEVAEEKRAVFRALTRLRGAAITSFDGIARSQTGNIDEYNKVNSWRKDHPLHHLADEESDVSKWAFPDNADF